MTSAPASAIALTRSIASPPASICSVEPVISARKPPMSCGCATSWCARSATDCHYMHAGWARREGGRGGKPARRRCTRFADRLGAGRSAGRREQCPGDDDGDAEQQRRHGDEERIGQRLGEARHAGRTRQRDDLRLDRHGAAVGGDAIGLKARLQAVELGALRLGDGLELAQLHLVIAGADDLLLHVLRGSGAPTLRAWRRWRRSFRYPRRSCRPRS